MIEYAMLGTSHDIQGTSEFEKPLTDAIRKYSARMVAEEYTLDNPSMACVTTKHLHIPYLQIDLFPQEWPGHGIDREMQKRESEQPLRGQDIRLSHADAVREEFWLDKIEASLDRGCVLVICGYLHVDFLAQKVKGRGCTVVEKSTFPANLLDRKPDKILNPTELENFRNNMRGPAV
jgi:hypothetical protein